MSKVFLLVMFWVQLLAVGAVRADGHPALTEADEAYSAEHFEEAARLYRRDAELGLVAAQINIALMYLDGQGVPQDYGQARLWFQRAAEQRYPEAQYNLGLLHRDGKGVPQDLVEADRWFILAGAKDEAAAVEKSMSEAQKAQARQLVQTWIAAHGKNGDK